jgi:hypothetical protein
MWNYLKASLPGIKKGEHEIALDDNNPANRQPKNTPESDLNRASKNRRDSSDPDRCSSRLRTALPTTAGQQHLPLTEENLTRIAGNFQATTDSETSSILTTITVDLEKRGFTEPLRKQPKELNYSKIKQGALIAKGGFGSIFHAEIHHDGEITPCALKINHYENKSGTSDLRHEAAIGLQANHHPHINRTHGYSEDAGGIVMELAMGNILNTVRALDAEETTCQDASAIAKYMLKQIISGLFHLFRRRIAHHDIRAINIFHSRGKLLLGDLGLASFVPKDQYSIVNPEDSFAEHPENPMSLVKNLLKYVKNEDISSEDRSLISKLSSYAEKEMGSRSNKKSLKKSEQRDMRNIFTSLNLRAEKWDCMSSQELHQKIKQYT